MSQTQQICQQSYQHYSNRKCPHPVYKDGLCIFHYPKLTEKESEELPEGSPEYAENEQMENIFRDELYEKLDEWNGKPDIEEFDFEWFQFPDIDFSKNTLLYKIGWDGFNMPVSFFKATFCGWACFGETQFSGKANFRATTFSGVAEFIGAQFSNLALFYDATFSSKANFSGANFFGRATFFRTTFSDKHTTAEFDFAKFSGRASFIEAKFLGVADFRYATFEKEAIFQGDEDSDNECFRGHCNFKLLKVSKDARVELQKVNLSKASFLDTDLEQLIFRDVDWHNPRTAELEKKKTLWQKAIQFFLPNREIALWDEFRELEKDEEERDYAKIAENYRQLILNYEGKRNFEIAEQFITGEMEVRRKRLGAGKTGWWKKTREWFNGYNAYRLLSNYGTSYWQASSVLLFLLIIFTGVFMYTGVSRVNMETSSYESAVNYDLFPLSGLQFVGWKQLCKDSQETMSYSLSILPFQRVELYRPYGVLTRAVKAIAVLLIYAQIAIFLLAVRRRFRHK